MSKITHQEAKNTLYFMHEPQNQDEVNILYNYIEEQEKQEEKLKIQNQLAFLYKKLYVLKLNQEMIKDDFELYKESLETENDYLKKIKELELSL